jgi:hypothetical protein
MNDVRGSNLYLYTSVGCHLCEKAEALLQEVLGEDHERVLPMEIADSDDLMASYGLRIPVIAGNNRDGEWCELGWPFDAADLRDFLRQFHLPARS